MLEIQIEYHSGIPVYKQIISAFISAIDLREINAGEKMPSIRQLSDKLNINPNTTAKVYRELDIRGYIESNPGSGCFVLSQEDKKLSAPEKQIHMKTLLNNMLIEAKKFQISEQDIIVFLKKEMK